MLLQFDFSNYKSFRDDTILDMTAAGISEYSNHVCDIGNERVLPVAAIYGANAGGKSNVYDAFEYMSLYIINSLHYGSDGTERKRKSEFMKPTPFLFDSASREAVSTFEVYFITPEGTGEKIYNYGFSVNQTGVQEEWLNYKSKSERKNYRNIFYRNGLQLSAPGLGQKSIENLRVALEQETLVVSLGAKLKIAKLKQIRDWFLGNEVINFSEPVENYFLSSHLPDGFPVDEQVQKRVVNYFNTFDSSVVGFDVEILDDGAEGDDARCRVFSKHRMNDSEGTARLPLEQESAGTLKMFALYPYFESVFQSGGVLFVDELNAKLHPLLMRAIIVSFIDPETNPNHAQLIFTTHDSWLLDSDTMRRDEIWMVEKGTAGASEMYSLSDFKDDGGAKIRKDENHEKNYLLGKYGAIPRLNSIHILGGDR